jgi:TP901 family phage tail tape measure protein
MDAVFSVQAIMSLQDLISGKLDGIRRSLAATGRETQALGARMGALAKGMLPLVVVAGMVLLGLGGAVGKAADFEQAMSKVKAAAGGTAADLASLRQNALDMGAQTSFSALQAAEAQENLAKAGLGANQIVAAMPGVLSMAAAGDIGLAQAAEAATDTMKTFRMEASQIGFIGDIMAATANRTSTDIGLMTQSLKNASSVAASVGVPLLDLSAMIGTLADQGIKGAEAGTQLKTAMLRISAPGKDAAKQLTALGIKTRDAKGNILPIFDVLGSLESKLAGMGSGQKADILKTIFGDDAISAINALFNKGIAKVRAFSGELANSTGSAAETAATKLDNLKGSVEGLSGSAETLLIHIGTPLLVPLTKLTQGVTKVINVLSMLADTDAGRTVIELAAGAATLVVASAAVAAGLWALSLAGAAVSWALAPLGAALAALGAPVWAVVAVVVALAVAWKTNFGGMKTTLTEWWDKAVLVCKGVAAVFGSLTGSTGELKGQLAKDIEAKGLLGVVTSIGKVVFRVRQFFVYLWDAFQDGTKNVGSIFAPLASAFDPIFAALAPLGEAFNNLFAIGADSKLSAWGAAGRVVGDLLGTAFRLIALGIRFALVPLQLIGAVFGAVVGLFTGQGGTLAALGDSLGNVFSGLWQSLEAAFPQVAAWLEKIGMRVVMWAVGLGSQITQSLATAWQSITSWFSGLDITGTLSGLFAGAGAAITAALSGVGPALSGWWDGIGGWFAGLDPVAWITTAFAGVGEAIAAGFAQVTAYLATIDLSAAGAAIMNTLVAGVKSAGSAVAGAVKSAFNAVTPFLTHSDAKEGPLSTLTASGRAIMTTLATGVSAAGPKLASATAAAMAGAALTLATPMTPTVAGPDMPALAASAAWLPESIDAPGLPDLTASASWAAAPLPDVRLPDTTAAGKPAEGGSARGSAAPRGVTIHNLTVTLPNVQDGEGFKRELQRLVEQYHA